MVRKSITVTVELCDNVHSSVRALVSWTTYKYILSFMIMVPGFLVIFQEIYLIQTILMKLFTTLLPIVIIGI